MRMFRRRDLLASSAFIVFGEAAAQAGLIGNGVPWLPAAGQPPRRVMPGPWHFFSPAEGETIEAIVDRLIPPDPEWPGGKEAGCAVFIDRQLAGPFGRADGQYMSGPFKKGTKEQGPQTSLTPAEQYRKVLAAIDARCKQTYEGRSFILLDEADKDKMIGAIERGELEVDGVETKSFFTTLLKNTREGFFADPIYGGNRNMSGWRMIGFPGARYDYSDWIDRHNERYPHGPISIMGAPSWSPG